MRNLLSELAVRAASGSAFHSFGAKMMKHRSPKCLCQVRMDGEDALVGETTRRGQGEKLRKVAWSTAIKTFVDQSGNLELNNRSISPTILAENILTNKWMALNQQLAIEVVFKPQLVMENFIAIYSYWD